MALQQPLFSSFEQSLSEGLNRALAASPPPDSAAATVALARAYAETIDADPAKLPKLGRHYHAALQALGLAPGAGRAAPSAPTKSVAHDNDRAPAEPEPDPASATLSSLREQYDRRAYRAAPMDAAAS